MSHEYEDGISICLVQCPHVRGNAIEARSPATNLLLVCVDCFWAVDATLKEPGGIKTLARKLEAATSKDGEVGWEAVEWVVSSLDLRTKAATS